MSAWAITGAGIIAATGDSPGCLFEALCARRSLVRDLGTRGVHGAGRGGGAATTPVTSRSEAAATTPDVVPSAPVVGFDPKVYIARKGLRDLSRTSQLACAAAAEAARAVEGLDGAEVGVVLGTAWGSLRTVVDFERAAQVHGPRFVDPLLFTETVSNVPAGQIAIFNGWSAFNATVASGSVSGLGAIGEAMDLLEEGRAVAAMAGGADELSVPLLRALLREGRLAASPGSFPFGAGRRGPGGGEGACLLAIEDEQGARRRGAGVLGRIIASSMGFVRVAKSLPLVRGSVPRLGAFDPSGQSDATRPQPTTQDAVAMANVQALADRLDGCIRESLVRAGLAPDEIDLLVLSGNGSLAGDAAEARAVVSVFEEGAGAPPILAPKAVLGETWGASAPLAVVAALEAMRRGFVPGMPDGFVTAEDAAGLNIPPAGLELRMRHALVLALTESGHVGALVVAEAS